MSTPDPLSATRISELKLSLETRWKTQISLLAKYFEWLVARLTRKGFSQEDAHDAVSDFLLQNRLTDIVQQYLSKHATTADRSLKFRWFLSGRLEEWIRNSQRRTSRQQNLLESNWSKTAAIPIEFESASPAQANPLTVQDDELDRIEDEELLLQIHQAVAKLQSELESHDAWMLEAWLHDVHVGNMSEYLRRNPDRSRYQVNQAIMKVTRRLRSLVQVDL